MSILRKPIQLKRYGCRLMGGTAQPVIPSVNLFVKVTNSCNANCLFCSNAGSRNLSSSFNIDKLFAVIRELQDKNIFVNRLNITGGEPSVVSKRVETILEKCDEKEFQHIHVHLNTNGLLSQSQELMRHPRWNSISMSLHHYDLQSLSALYGTKISDEAFSLTGIDKQKLNISCNLIKGYIDSPAEVKNMLDFALGLDIPRIGFVSLMPINDYCKTHYVDFDAIKIDSIPHVYFIKSMSRDADCKCSNYLYNKDLKILEIYMRNNMNPAYCESSLVYDGEYLRQGFQQDNIII